jgi:dihydroxyacetone kinase-like predicted kinase
VGGNHHIKIHIHTDTPEDLMKLCEQYAVIVDFKSDDMRQMIDDHAQILRPVHA